MFAVWRAMLFGVAALTACGPPPEDCEAAGRLDPTLRLGTGFADYVPIRSGDQLGIVFGEQGGWHVWMAFQTTGLVVGHKKLGPPDPEGPTFTFWLSNGADEEIAAGEHSRIPIDGDAEEGEILGLAMFLSSEVNNAIADGGANPASGDLILEAEVMDSCGTEVSAQRRVELDVSQR